MDDPTNEQALAEIATAAGVPVKPMIASPNDIRSAIRVYYADLNTADQSTAPLTTRERAPTLPGDRERPPPPPPAAGAPPPAPPARPPPPPVTGRAPLATVVDTVEILAVEALTETGENAAATPPKSMRGDSPDADPELEVGEYIVRKRQQSGPRMVALTLLDGTTLNLPARSSPPEAAARREGSRPPSAGGLSDQLTARDLVSALRAVAHGADASEILGETDWQAMFAALLSVLLKKNLIADWEFVEELRNI
jgi:type IV pilus assembly protein PilB